MVQINDQIVIPEEEIEVRAVRAQGPGGQNVNKVSSAVHLRFDILASSLPKVVKERLLATRDRRISAAGVLVIKAQNHRSREKNRAEAVDRMRQLILDASTVQKKRVPTRPGRAARERRLEEKKKRGSLKRSRATKYE